jgi:hypothetical protein
MTYPVTGSPLIQFWRKLDAELKRLHEEPADLLDAIKAYAIDAADVLWAAEIIRSQRIRASHAEEGEDI